MSTCEPHLLILGLVAHRIHPAREDGIYYGANLTWLATLAHNLAWAASLCEAARRGPLNRHPQAHEPHEFAGYECDCTICGEGCCYYLHTDRPEYEP